MAPVNAVGSTGQAEIAQGSRSVKSGGAILANVIVSVENGVAEPIYNPVSNSGHPFAAFCQPAATAQTSITHGLKPVRLITAAGEEHWIAIGGGEARVKWDADNRTWRLFDPANTAKRGAPVKFQNGIWQVHGDVGLKGGGGALSRLFGSESFDQTIPPEIYAYRPHSKLSPSKTYTVYDAKWALEQAQDLTNRENFCAIFDQNFRIKTQGIRFNLKEFFQSLYQDSVTFRRFFNYAADHNFHSHFSRAFKESSAGHIPGLSIPAFTPNIWTVIMGKRGHTGMQLQAHTIRLYANFPEDVAEFYIGSEGDLVRVTFERKAVHEFLHVLTGMTHDAWPVKCADPELPGLGERGGIVYLENRIILEAKLDMSKRAIYEVFAVIGASSDTARIPLNSLTASTKKEMLPAALQNIPFERLVDRAIRLMNYQDAYLDHLFPLSEGATIQTEIAPAAGPSDFLEVISGLH